MPFKSGHASEDHREKYQTEFNLPVYYVTELVAIACGAKPPTVGTNRHFVEANAIFSQLPAKARPWKKQLRPARRKGKGQLRLKRKRKAKLRLKKDSAEILESWLKIYDDETRAGQLAVILTEQPARASKLAEYWKDKDKATRWLMPCWLNKPEILKERREQGVKRVGVFVCECGTNIGSVVDAVKVAETSLTMPEAFATNYKYMCSDPGQDLIKNAVEEHGLEQVVVASCSPRMHENTFRKAMSGAGLNPYMFEMVNIREHVSWVHTDKEEATRKATDLVRMAVMKVVRNKPLQVSTISN